MPSYNFKSSLKRLTDSGESSYSSIWRLGSLGISALICWSIQADAASSFVGAGQANFSSGDRLSHTSFKILKSASIFAVAFTNFSTIWAWGSPRSWYSMTWIRKTVVSSPKYLPFFRLWIKASSLALNTSHTIAGISKQSASGQITCLNSSQSLLHVAVMKSVLAPCSVTKWSPLMANFFRWRGLPWKDSPKKLGVEFGSMGTGGGRGTAAAAPPPRAAAVAALRVNGLKKAGGLWVSTSKLSPNSPSKTSPIPPSPSLAIRCTTPSSIPNSAKSSGSSSSELSSTALSCGSSAPKNIFWLFLTKSNLKSRYRDIWSTKYVWPRRWNLSKRFIGKKKSTPSWSVHHLPCLP